jgi:aminoglycoside phosphotransferase (APT) family kinase protein
MCNNYSIDYCINNCEEFERVGFPELGRNEVFFDKKNKCYVKFYGIPSHFTNEKAALHYYKNFYLAPKLEFESETCLGIKSINGKILKTPSLTQYHYMGIALRKLHEFSRVSKNINTSYNEYYLEEHRKWNKLCNKLTKHDSERWKDAIVNAGAFLNNFKICGNDYIVLCHNDYCERNILFKNDKIAGIIDFEKSRFADPACDLATMVIKELGTSNLSMFLASYSLTNITKSRFFYFPLYKALEIITWAETVDKFYYQKAVDFLLHWETLYEYI